MRVIIFKKSPSCSVPRYLMSMWVIFTPIFYAPSPSSTRSEYTPAYAEGRCDHDFWDTTVLYIQQGREGISRTVVVCFLRDGEILCIYFPAGDIPSQAIYIIPYNTVEWIT